jgi:hypothetical protein
VEGDVLEPFPVQVRIDGRRISREDPKRGLALQVAHHTRVQQIVQKLMAIRVNDRGPALIVRPDDEQFLASGCTTRPHKQHALGGERRNRRVWNGRFQDRFYVPVLRHRPGIRCDR